MVQLPTLTTERLTLRPVEMSDASALFEIYGHPVAMRFWHTPPHTSVEQTAHTISHNNSQELQWAMCLKDSNRVIGQITYIAIDDVPGLGYILHPDYWNNGYTTEATRAAVECGFTTLGLNRVELWIDKRNKASLRVAAKVGFTCRGRFRQKYHHDASSHEKLVLGMHIDEWRQNPVDTTPMHFYSLQPILAVHDVQTTAQYYVEKLGFRIGFMYGDPPTHGAVVSNEFTPEGAKIQLTRISHETQLQPQTMLYIFVGPAIDDLYALYQSRGVTIDRTIETMPWGNREFRIKDCNGYLIRFGTEV